MKKIVLLCSCLLFAGWLSAQSRTISDLKKEDNIRTGYYLYPSTIRMLNLGDDPELNRLVKDVRKLSLLNMKSGTFDQAKMDATIERLQQKEQMETYIEVKNDSLHVIVLGDQDDRELITIARSQEDFYIAELEGTLNLGVVPKLIDNFNNRDTSQSNGFAMIFDALNKDINQQKYWENKREERRKQREEKARSEGESTENTPVDSALKKEDTLKKEPIKGPKS
jgi:hypothetical protein